MTVLHFNKKSNLGFLMTLPLIGILMTMSCSPKIMVVAKADKTEIKLSEKILFHADGLQTETVEWNFGDGNKSIEKNPNYRYTKSGNHTVTLRVTKNKKVKESKISVKVMPTEDCLIQIETSMGNMLVKLYQETPQHRDNIIKLAEQGFYNDLIFHRVISGFMIQGGDPNSKGAAPGAQLGSGGPSYTIPAEFNKDLIHQKGALAAARTGDQVNPMKKSSGSQFYIVQGSLQNDNALSRIEDQKGIKYTAEQKKIYNEVGGTPFLDNEYTVFGQVIDGLDVIDKIAATPTMRGDRPEKDVWMRIKVLH